MSHCASLSWAWHSRQVAAWRSSRVKHLWWFFFFFQAEDGIRDLTVTGVQTCALPISISAMLLNIAANMMGLGNAATPFGIKAMEELEKLNPTPGTATNAQVLFLAINTASLQLVPTTVIALRASARSNDPAEVLLPTLLATVCALTVAILAAKLLERVWK